MLTDPATNEPATRSPRRSRTIFNILTIGTSLALLAPVSQAAAAGNAPGCGSRGKPAASNTGGQLPSPSQGFRALQHAVIGDRTATTQPVRTTCAKKQIRAVPPNHYQVLKNSF